MAKQRTKSRNDILRQSGRLLDEISKQYRQAAESGDRKRMEELLNRETRIAHKTSGYVANIEKQKSYRADIENWREKPNPWEALEEVKNRQWSRRTYMGIGTGG